MSTTTLLSADLDGSPLPCATWQADLENQLPYFTRAFHWRFRRLEPELRDEQVQEAIVQVAILISRQYELHGGRISYRKELSRTVAYKVGIGRSCTRPHAQHADTMDRSDTRAAGIARKPFYPLADAPGRADLPADTRIDVEEWIGRMPPRLREYATLAYHGTPDEEIQRIMGVGKGRIAQIRTQLKKMWYTEMA